MKYKCLESLRGETRGSSDKAQTSFRIGQLWKSPSMYRHTILLVQIVLNAECSFMATEQQQRAGVVVGKKKLKPTKYELDRLQSLMVINKVSNSAIKII